MLEISNKNVKKFLFSKVTGTSFKNELLLMCFSCILSTGKESQFQEICLNDCFLSLSLKKQNIACLEFFVWYWVCSRISTRIVSRNHHILGLTVFWTTKGSHCVLKTLSTKLSWFYHNFHDSINRLTALPILLSLRLTGVETLELV